MSHIDRVREVVAATLKLPVDRVGADAAIDVLPEWDSVAHVNLMMSIEQEFDLFLEVEDFARLTSVEAIAEFVAQARV